MQFETARNINEFLWLLIKNSNNATAPIPISLFLTWYFLIHMGRGRMLKINIANIFMMINFGAYLFIQQQYTHLYIQNQYFTELFLKRMKEGDRAET